MSQSVIDDIHQTNQQLAIAIAGDNCMQRKNTEITGAVLKAGCPSCQQPKMWKNCNVSIISTADTCPTQTHIHSALFKAAST